MWDSTGNGPGTDWLAGGLRQSQEINPMKETARSRPEGGQPVRAPAFNASLHEAAVAVAVGDAVRHRYQLKHGKRSASN
jgi:hypothetical protein